MKMGLGQYTAPSDYHEVYVDRGATYEMIQPGDIAFHKGEDNKDWIAARIIEVNPTEVVWTIANSSDPSVIGNIYRALRISALRPETGTLTLYRRASPLKTYFGRHTVPILLVGGVLVAGGLIWYMTSKR